MKNIEISLKLFSRAEQKKLRGFIETRNFKRLTAWISSNDSIADQYRSDLLTDESNSEHLQNLIDGRGEQNKGLRLIISEMKGKK